MEDCTDIRERVFAAAVQSAGHYEGRTNHADVVFYTVVGGGHT